MKNLELNIIWKEDKIKKIDDENLMDKSGEKYFFNPSLSNKEKLIFSRNNVMQTLKKKMLIGIAAIVITIVVFFIVVESGGSGIGSVLLLGIGVMILGLLATPFSTYKNLIFENDLKPENKKISKQNVFGSISTFVSFRDIKRVVMSTDKKNTYITFREKNQDKVSDTAPILVIISNNQEQINLMEKFISEYIIFGNENIEFAKINVPIKE